MTESELETLEAQFSDYLDGTMTPEQRAAFERELAASEQARRAFEEFKRTVEAVSGLHKVAAPQRFESSVEERIHRRSAGRFFGRKAFGDRVPFELLAVIALAILLALYLIYWRSDTGSLELGGDRDQVDAVDPSVREAIPRP